MIRVIDRHPAFSDGGRANLTHLQYNYKKHQRSSLKFSVKSDNGPTYVRQPAYHVDTIGNGPSGTDSCELLRSRLPPQERDMKNLLLDQLSTDDLRRLEPHLKTTPIKQRSVLFEADEPIKHVYFPMGAVVSLVVTLKSGQIVEAAMVGADGVVGASSGA